MASGHAERDIVAHVNYLFFHSTQSFIYFFLSRFQRVHPICLTRTPESTAVKSELPPALAKDFYLYGQEPGVDSVKGLLWLSGLRLRHLLARVSPRLAEPLLDSLHRRVVPRFRR